jgi:hypothetical protein
VVVLLAIDLKIKALLDPFMRSAIYAADLPTALAVAQLLDREITFEELRDLLARYNELNEVPTRVLYNI